MRFKESDLERVFGVLDTDAEPRPEHREEVRRKMLAVFDQAEQDRKNRGTRRPWPLFRLAHGGWRVLGKWAAAAALLLVVVGALWLIAGGRPAVASDSFASVLQRIQEALSVSYDIRFEGEGLRYQAHVALAEPGLLRHETSDGKTWVMDFVRKKGLMLSATGRTAFLAAGDEMRPRSALDLLTYVRKLSRRDGRFVGKTTLDGRAANVFQADVPRQKITIWTSPTTDLPIRVEILSYKDPKDDKKGQWGMILTDFSWNDAASGGIFNLDPPPGYTVRDLHAEETTEMDLTDSLRLCAAMSSGLFPDKFDKVSVATLALHAVAKSDNVLQEKGVAGSDVGLILTGEPTNDQNAARRLMLRGLRFAQKQAQSGNGWHYRGAGIRLGDSRNIVCWWKPRGSSGYRAVLGDLTVRTVNADELQGPDTLPDAPPLESDSMHK